MQRRVIPAIFALSGAAGLIFEVVWARQLVLVFGNTTQAVSAILTGFFGGMAIGSWYGGRLADRVARPLMLYAALELGLTVVVLLTPLSFPLIHEAYRVGYTSLAGTPALLSLLRFFLALLALAPATVLMGATLPTLTRHLARWTGSLGKEFTGLYVANTMGAVFGAAAAGFILIELFGLSGALIAGACCSASAGLIALGLDVFAGEGSRASGLNENEPTRKPDEEPGRVTLALTFAFISGFTSLSYQTLWTRLIASGTGSSTYVFTTILTVFLTGLAMGAVEYKRVRERVADIAGVLAVTQVATGLLAAAGMIAINALDSLPGAFAWKALAAVLPATFVMGYGFPASSALMRGSGGQTGRPAGMLLASNTAGAITGTFVVPFFLIPTLGSPLMVAVTACINVLAGLLIALRAGTASLRMRTLVITGASAFGVVLAGAAVSRSIFIDPHVARMKREGATLLRSTEDEIASVQAGEANGRKQLWVTGFSMTFLTVDARLMPLLPLMVRPESKSVLTIAFGMGSSFRSALVAGLSSDAVELVPSVPGMFDVFHDDAEQIASNPRGRIIVGDGRNFVELTKRSYDIIVVDPPPPLQSSGVSIISSREFYEASRMRLTRGGVMMQWVPWGQSLSDFRSHVRTFRSVFPNVIIMSGPGGNGFYMLGSESAMSFAAGNIADVLSRPGVAADISSAFDSPVHNEEGWRDLIPRLVRLTGPDVAAFAGQGPMITDDRPLPEYFLIREARSPSQWLKPGDVRPPEGK